MLDPFTGCGTVQVQANKLGWTSHGYDPHPVFFRIASAKAMAFKLSPDLPKIYSAISKGIEAPVSISTLEEKPREFLSKLFERSVLEMLLGAKASLSHAKVASNHLSFLILSKMIDLCSKSQTDGIYKAPTSTKRAERPSVALDRVYSMILEDMKTLSPNECSIINKSSKTMSETGDGGISSIITSPPYLNNFDYAEMTRMYLYFWGIAESWGDITDKVRVSQIVNTTTSLKGHKQRQEEYRTSLSSNVRQGADEIVSLLQAERQVRAGKREYDFLVYPYFSQMQNVLRECLRVLNTGGRFHMMVADAALYGVHVPSPQILAQIMKDAGFENVSCELVRKRGHRWILDKRDGSKTGLGEYYVYGERN